MTTHDFASHPLRICDFTQVGKDKVAVVFTRYRLNGQIRDLGFEWGY